MLAMAQAQTYHRSRKSPKLRQNRFHSKILKKCAVYDLPAIENRKPRAYGWGEDGLAGISDDQQRFHLALALSTGGIPFSRNASSG